MAALLFLAPLLLLGTVAGQAQTEMEACSRLGNATEGNFSVETTPGTYSANRTYVVTIKDDRNHSSTGQYLLQALSPQNTSLGEWKGAPTGNCSSITTAVLNIPQRTANWTAPQGNLSSVQIRVYLTLSNKTELKTYTLSKGAETTRAPSITSPSSAWGARGSSLLLAALQLPLLLLLSLLS